MRGRFHRNIHFDTIEKKWGQVLQSYISEEKERRKRKTKSVFLNPIYAVVRLGIGAVGFEINSHGIDVRTKVFSY